MRIDLMGHRIKKLTLGFKHRLMSAMSCEMKYLAGLIRRPQLTNGLSNDSTTTQKMIPSICGSKDFYIEDKNCN